MKKQIIDLKCKMCRQDLFDEESKAAVAAFNIPLKSLAYGVLFFSVLPTTFALVMINKRPDISAAVLLTVLVVRVITVLWRLHKHE